ncbi:hypothetical protein D3C71_1508330 [compost metagenome]
MVGAHRRRGLGHRGARGSGDLGCGSFFGFVGGCQGGLPAALVAAHQQARHGHAHPALAGGHCQPVGSAVCGASFGAGRVPDAEPAYGHPVSGDVSVDVLRRNLFAP